MFGWIRRWWRRRTRSYRCDECGRTVVRSPERADVRVERIADADYGPEMERAFARIGLRSAGGWRVVLRCPEYAAKAQNAVPETRGGKEEIAAKTA